MKMAGWGGFRTRPYGTGGNPGAKIGKNLSARHPMGFGLAENNGKAGGTDFPACATKINPKIWNFPNSLSAV
jgi:hypothetical protein